MDLWIGTVNLGLLYAFMALGTFITYKLYNFPDITIDGSFTTGAAVAAILIVDGMNPLPAMGIAFVAGALAGFITGVIHTRFRIEGLLAGILVMTGLYSVNLHVMGRSNVPLLNSRTFVMMVESLNPGIHSEIWMLIILLMALLIVWMLLSVFLRTDFGLALIATGSNPVMIAAQGISVNRMKIFGISLANGMVGLSGALVAQYQGFADVGMGIGSIVFSLAAVIIGEAILPGRSMMVKVLSVIAGSIVFRLAVALSLNFGMDPNDLKIATAVFVLITLIITRWLAKRHDAPSSGWLKRWKGVLRVTVIILLLLTIVLSIIHWLRPSEIPSGKPKIGIILANQSSLLTETRDGLLYELGKLGYKDGENCQIIEQNAQGEIANNATIVGQMIDAGVDIFVPISTASTQAVIGKVKDKPVVFATVASPFVIQAGSSPEVHLPNVTGVYGSAPVGDLLKRFTELCPGRQSIGTIFNPAFPNTKVNFGELEKALKDYPRLTLESVAVSSTNEVYQAALALASRDIRAFILINDLTVFEAFESVVKVSLQSRIPVFTNDAERLADGALIISGYEYFGSGMQAAHLVDRILKGDNPAGIPFEIYRFKSFGINFDMAGELKITIPEGWIKDANAYVRKGVLNKSELVMSPGTQQNVKP